MSTWGRKLLVVATVGTAACTPSAIEPSALRAEVPNIGLFPGERMRFDVTLAGMVVGEAQLAVGEPGMVDGHPALAVSSQVTAAGVASMVMNVQDDASTVIDLTTWRPLTTAGDATYGKNHLTSAATYDNDKVKVRFQRNTSPESTLSFAFDGKPPLDAHTSIAAVRMWDAVPGEELELWMVGGKRVWHVDVVMNGRETIGTDDGNRAALRFDGVAQRMKRDLTPDKPTPRTFSVWVSDDADRVPLKVRTDTEYGEVVLTLTGYEAGHEVEVAMAPS